MRATATRRASATAGTAVFLVVVPGSVAGVVPWWLTGWRSGAADHPFPVRVLGVVLVAAGAGVLLHAFASFVIEGLGTPAPPAPTERLVIGGLYRYIRNPMYLAVLIVIIGQELLLARPVLFAYAAAVAAAVVSFVYGYEQPTLTRRYGEQYEHYRRDVPAWWPRFRRGRSRSARD
ncbi:MAG TPA: isoprenylcysteine carboxylmethyltransferase family protein [Mycobacterium sp.]|nr:isoprenylcysteine carboxylmethyltransferase family protein [Mycobacterium sp.]